jgi:hypothetical protein
MFSNAIERALDEQLNLFEISSVLVKPCVIPHILALAFISLLEVLQARHLRLKHFTDNIIRF